MPLDDDRIVPDPNIQEENDQAREDHIVPSSVVVIGRGLKRKRKEASRPVQQVPEIPPPTVSQVSAHQVVPSSPSQQEELPSESVSSADSDIDRVLDMEDDGEFSDEGEWTPQAGNTSESASSSSESESESEDEETLGHHGPG